MIVPRERINTPRIYRDGVAVITVRIDENLKDRMKTRKGVNWSEVIRRAIRERVEAEERLEAAKEIDAMGKRVRAVHKGELVRWIREDRGR